MLDECLTVSISGPVPETRLAQLTRDLERDLFRQGIKARLVAADFVPGERGDPVTLGVLALAFITSGAAKSLIDCLKAYLAREPALTIALSRPDGVRVEVNARNVDATSVQEAVEAAASVRLGEEMRPCPSALPFS